MKKTLFTGFSPNTRGSDMRIVLSFLLFPWKWGRWKKGSAEKTATEAVGEYLEGYSATTFDSGRSALYIALQALGVQKDDEVLVQAFTCVVVINAIHALSATPVYVDIERHTLNMDPESVKKNITPKTKALIIQHTFGLPADIDTLLAIAGKHNISTVEDCAHSLGARYKGKYTGTYADIGMYSFGGEKVVSCVRGGALITADAELQNKISIAHAPLAYPSRGFILQHLLHVLLFPIGKATYHLFVGKALLKVAKTLRITHRISTRTEKEGGGIQPRKLPNVLASLLVHQLKSIDEYNDHRKSTAESYTIALDGHALEVPGLSASEHIYLRYPLLVEDPDRLRARAKKAGIILGDWYSVVVGPKDTDAKATKYIEGTCPVAEQCSKEVLNLPTNIHISLKDVQRIAEIITE